MGVVRESPQTYQTGALLENGARLAEIHNDYVLLRKAGDSARVYLANAASAGNIGDTNLLTVGGPKEAPPPAKITSREVLTDYIRPSPVYDGENLVGYQVYPGAKRTPYDQLGLQSGDVIVEINDLPLTDPATSWDLLRGLAGGDVLSVVVKRGTGVQRMTLDGALLVSAEESRRQESVQAMLAPPTQ
jgi:type II secretion system protein C